jgi:hypothetical protein
MMLVMALGIWPGMARVSAERVSAETTPVAPIRVSNRFEFHVQAPLSRVAPLFGPEGERCWAGKHWDPVFLSPRPGRDVQGAVFTVQHGPHTSVWVNTIFDLAAGRMQYVAVIPDVMAFTVDVKLKAASAASTDVEVTYARTALNADVNDDVAAMGADDRQNGPHWQQAIEDYLKSGGGACGGDGK